MKSVCVSLTLAECLQHAVTLSRRTARAHQAASVCVSDVKTAPRLLGKKSPCKSIVSKLLRYKKHQIPKPLHAFNTICIKYI